MKPLYLIALPLLITGCQLELDVDLQVNPYVCINGWKYEPYEPYDSIVDEYGAHETCIEKD